MQLFPQTIPSISWTLASNSFDFSFLIWAPEHIMIVNYTPKTYNIRLEFQPTDNIIC